MLTGVGPLFPDTMSRDEVEFNLLLDEHQHIVRSMAGGVMPWEMLDDEDDMAEATKEKQQVVITPPKGLTFLRANQVADRWGMNMVLFGVPGVGKTRLAGTAQDSPYGKDVFFIDVEGGTRTVGDREDITVFRPEAWSEVFQVFKWLAEEDHPFRTIVIDTLSELQRLGLKEILQTAKDPEWPGIQDWGRSTEQITRLVRAFRAFSTERGWNVIFTSHANEQKDEVTGKMFIRPNLTPKATELVCGAVDMVGYMSINREGERELLLEPTNTIVAKYRQGATGPQMPSKILNPSLVDIFAHAHGEDVYEEV